MPNISFISKDYYDFTSRGYEAAIDYRVNDGIAHLLIGKEKVRQMYYDRYPFAVWEAENSFYLKKMYVEERIHNIQDAIGLIRRLIRK